MAPRLIVRAELFSEVYAPRGEFGERRGQRGRTAAF